MKEDTVIRFLLTLVTATLLLCLVFFLGTRQELRLERKVGQGKAYVLTLGAVVETEDENADVVKCYFAAGDVIRVDQVEEAGEDRMVTVSYAPVEPGDPATDVRCPAGTSVTFVEMSVEQLIGKE